ncbi:hypothetical protein Tther_01428 [Tepidimonas thermarum]|uniref:Uncharacterized protein n=1 Tax=Tepidimonas thermarum TaxID=335431 RepID=A0A554X0Y4_9BURK|nr:hypothetical protein Tther_01428 [Tepidimonas thermarum]
MAAGGGRTQMTLRRRLEAGTHSRCLVKAHPSHFSTTSLAQTTRLPMRSGGGNFPAATSFSKVRSLTCRCWDS